jgi:hypothetical protein
MSGARDPFFIGWEKRLPAPLRLPLLGAALGLLVLALLLPLALGRATDDTGSGDWAGDRELRGTLTARPYPLLTLPPDAAHPLGHTVLLSAFGKAQVSTDLAGRAVRAAGVLLKRGDLEMLVVNDPAQLAALPEALPAPVPPVPLGRWAMVGEICDGKCATGAMHAGTGIAHRACARLCLAGDIPPVLVTVQPAEGSSFFLLAGPDGGKLPDAVLRLVGLRLRLEGALERRGDLLVFRVDPASVQVL